MTGWQVFGQQLANGLTLGAIYALIALGYTMVYGVIQLINFAHGEVFMVGAYLALTALLALGMSASASGWALVALLAACAFFAMIGCGLLGFGIERAAYRPLRPRPADSASQGGQTSRLAALITAIGVSLVLQNAVMLVYGATDRRVPPVVPSIRWEFAGVSITLLHLMIWLGAAGLMIALHWLVMSTQLGRAMRAVAQDPKACWLLGIPVDRVVAMTFVIGSGLAGIGGMLFGLFYSTINFHDGYVIGLKAFTAAVLGVLEGLGAGYVSSQWKNAFAFIVLVLLLMFKPTGLLGERVADRA